MGLFSTVYKVPKRHISRPVRVFIYPDVLALTYTVPVKSLDTPTHSRVFLYLYYFPYFRIVTQHTSSQKVLSICGNSFKTVGKAFLMKMVERIPRVCKAVIKAKGGYFEEIKMYFDFFNTFSVTT